MYICKNCNKPMILTMSFSKGRQEKFFRCQKCYGETKRYTLKDDELYLVKGNNK